MNMIYRMFRTVISIGPLQSLVRALIFGIGHFVIDVSVITAVTDASPEQATLAALLSPAFNAVWYWILDYTWTQIHLKDEQLHQHIREDTT